MSLTISIANYTYIIDNFGKIIIQMDLNGSIIISGNVLMNIDGIRNIFMAIQALIYGYLGAFRGSVSFICVYPLSAAS